MSDLQYQFRFTVLRDGMICLEGQGQETDAARMRGRDPSRPRWSIARGLNHCHVDVDPAIARQGARDEREYARQLGEALRRTFPDRAFVISHLASYAVSFWEWEPDGPQESIPPNGPLYPKVWCTHCHRQQTYTPRTEPDDEFPLAEWGDCTVCGGEVLIRAGEELSFVGPVPGGPTNG
jgi:hypothetical protein